MKPSIPILPGLGIHPTNSGRLQISFPYHLDNVKRIKAVPGRRWEKLTAEEQALTARIEEEMKLRGYSPKTRKAYRNHLLRFRRYFDKDPQAVTEEEIRAYLLHLIDEKQVSYSTHNQSISAIKFLYNKVLHITGLCPF
ncbi:MAG: site-specific integrase [Gemmatimonadetes bacterium]|nr:site-specific integrase [Gemmatimonadota bacterium]